MQNQITPPWEGWKIVKKLGQGGFGTVYRRERSSYGVSETSEMKVISVPHDVNEFNELRNDGYSEQNIQVWCDKRANEILKEYVYW